MDYTYTTFPIKLSYKLSPTPKNIGDPASMKYLQEYIIGRIPKKKTKKVQRANIQIIFNTPHNLTET